MATGRSDIHAVLRSEILDGRYNGGVRFPSEQALARRFGVSRSTITRAIDRLKYDGLVVSRKGAGSRVRFEKLGGSRCIGILVPGPETNDFYAGIVKGAQEKCRDLGYEPLLRRVTAADGKMCQRREAAAVARDFIDNHVDGVLLFPFSPLCGGYDVNAIILGAMCRKGIVVQLVNRSVASQNGETCDLVSIDNFAAGRRVAAHLAERGVRRCVFLDMTTQIESVNLRYAGLAAEFSRVHGGVLNRVAVRTQTGNAVKAWLRRFRPQAFVCGGGVVSRWFVDTLHGIGVAVPRDVMVAGFDDVPSGAEIGLTAIVQPLAEIGRTAIARLVERLKNPSLPRCTILLDAPLVVRSSTAGRTRNASVALKTMKGAKQ